MAGRLLWSARVEEETGLELARLLNQAPRLSAALMAPVDGFARDDGV